MSDVSAEFHNTSAAAHACGAVSAGGARLALAPSTCEAAILPSNQVCSRAWLMIRLGVYLLIAGLPWMKACSLAVILVRPDSPDVVRLKVAVHPGAVTLAKMRHLGLQRDGVTRASPLPGGVVRLLAPALAKHFPVCPARNSKLEA